MADDKKEIPAWQRQSAPTPSEADLDKTKDAEQPTAATKSREDLMEQARTFLAHEEIQDSTTESKIAFLEDKGLTNEEIQQLLGVSRNETTAPEPAADTVQKPEPTTTTTTTTTSTSSTSQQPDAPPIITYPEFLLHASKPPPLVTPERALKAVYGASVIGAAIYGASKFVLQPMFETLSEARHDLFTTTKEHLEPLNQKLEEVVSTVPPAIRTSNVGHERRIDDDDDDDSSSIASDPTEMFHRDVGIQTSPPASPSLAATAAGEDEKTTPTVKAVSRLSSLKEHLDSLLETSNTAIESTDKTKQAMRETEVFLDQIRYGDNAGYSLGSDDSWRSQVLGKSAGLGKKVDAVDELKAEIRSMKGAMLSARNFPRGVSR